LSGAGTRNQLYQRALTALCFFAIITTQQLFITTMDVSGASIFLASAILMSAGIAILGIVVVFLNNLFSKYWKPVRIFTHDSWHFNPPTRFVTDDEINRITPTLDDPPTKK
jgi:hypothetical protein